MLDTDQAQINSVQGAARKKITITVYNSLRSQYFPLPQFSPLVPPPLTISPCTPQLVQPWNQGCLLVPEGTGGTRPLPARGSSPTFLFSTIVRCDPVLQLKFQMFKKEIGSGRMFYYIEHIIISIFLLILRANSAQFSFTVFNIAPSVAPQILLCLRVLDRTQDCCNVCIRIAISLPLLDLIHSQTTFTISSHTQLDIIIYIPRSTDKHLLKIFSIGAYYKMYQLCRFLRRIFQICYLLLFSVHASIYG